MRKRKNIPQLHLRLVKVRFGKTWYSYVTSVLELRFCLLLSWLIYTAVAGALKKPSLATNVKRLLGLSYLWTGSNNGVKLQSVGYLVPFPCIWLISASGASYSLPDDAKSLTYEGRSQKTVLFFDDVLCASWIARLFKIFTTTAYFYWIILLVIRIAVADELGLAFERISLEMLYRGLYHFGVARQAAKASDYYCLLRAKLLKIKT